MRFGDMLHRHRKRRGLTQRQLADLATLSVRAVRNLERGGALRPRRETVRLLAEVLRLDADQREQFEAAAFPGELDGGPWDSLVAPPPAPTTPLVGRTVELQALVDLLTDDGHRCLKVVGPAGVGKTRLLQELAGELYAGYEWPAIWWSGAPGEAAELARTVGDRDALLVVDGPDADPADLAALSRRCPGLRIVAASRQPESDPGGPLRAVPLGALGLPPECGPEGAGDTEALGEYPAVRVLMSNARRFVPSFRLDPQTARAVVTICRRLDGLPRALEHAAEWLLTFPPSDLVELARHDPLTLASSPAAPGGADATRAALSDSLASLTLPQRSLLEQMARRPGSWSSAEGPGRDAADPGVGRAVYALHLRGLLRSDSGSRHSRFTVLNLVRALCESEERQCAAEGSARLPQGLPVAGHRPA